jgi:hypothetical protein
VKPQLPGGKYGAGGGGGSSGGGGGGGGRQNKSGANQNRETSLHYKSKTRNAKLRKELRNLDDQIQVTSFFSLLYFRWEGTWDDPFIF